MAPKFKFTKEEVLSVTIDFIRENGIEALTARELAKKLDSSTKVIFSLFSNMKNLEDEAKFAAENIFSEKVNLALKDDSPFKRLGVEYILFSKNEPRLFQWLFMKKGIEVESFKDFLPMRDYEYKSVIESIDEEYKISIENSKKLYEHLFIYSHGIATLTVTGIHNFTPTEIIEYMTEVTKSLIVQYSKEIKKKYNDQEVLRGIDLKIDKNEFVVILGASGSGKSTLLNILSGLEKSDSGEVVYDNESISDYSEKQLTKFRKDKIGFVFQQYYLLNNLTVEQNVKVGANLANNKEYVDIIKELGLEDRLSKYPNELSGGEQQRVSIARALAKKPTVLFLDEPTGALDEETGRKILEYLLKLKDKSYFTMIMVTHNENIAELANKIIHVGSGRVTSIEENRTPKSVEEIGW